MADTQTDNQADTVINRRENFSLLKDDISHDHTISNEISHYGTIS